ncbi:MAG: PQQ-binding-like beta-propeller repeat protein [Nanoarchaeota archaeon]|nr:PQQ-binding-like beta-propeller repeat protein [Nanoarchaeota archaeon]
MIKGQVSVEYLIIVGILLLALTPIAYFAQEQAQLTTSLKQTQVSLKKIKNAVNVVNSLGPPSQQTLLVDIPEMINGTSTSDKTITFYTASGSDLWEEADTCIEGLLPENAGYHLITIKALDNGCVSIGAESIFIEPLSLTLLVDLGFSKTHDFMVTNTLSQPVNTNITATGGVASLVDTDNVTAGRQIFYDIGLLNAGESKSVTAEFFGDSLGEYSGVLEFMGEDSAVNSSVTVKVVQGVLNVEPVYQIINADLSEYNEVSIIINNTGEGTLYFTNLTVEPGFVDYIDLVSGGVKDSFRDLGNLSSGTHEYVIRVFGNQTGIKDGNVTARALFGQEVNASIRVNTTVPFIDYLEVVFSDWSWPRRVILLHGNNGSVKWESSSLNDYPDTLAIGDLNGDGLNDVVAGKNDWEIIYAFYGQNGTQMWNYTMTLGDDDLRSNIIIHEGSVFFGGDQKKVYKLNGSTGAETWISSDFAQNNVETIGAGNFNGDSFIDIVVNDNGNKQVYAYNGQDGTILWMTSMSLNAKGESRILIEEVTGDSYDDVFIGTNKNSVYLLNGSDGSEVWISGSVGASVDRIAVGDFNNDGTSDVAAMNDWEHYVYAFYGQNGTQMWIHDSSWENSYILHPVDLNNDGFANLVFGRDNQKSYRALHGINGSTFYDSSQHPVAMNKLDSGDLDLDGHPDLVGGLTWDHRIAAFYGINGSIIWTYSGSEDLNSNIIVGQVG